MSNLKHLDLFSGIGGFSLAGKWVGGFKTVQFVEIDSDVQETLKKNFPGIPIHDDITTFSAVGKQYDLITAGFPCQDISVAGTGNGSGLDGKRSGLFYEIVRIIRECRPSYILLENVAALLTSNNGRDMAAVLWELSESGYDAEWEIIPASALGANHVRERLWIIAYPTSVGQLLQDRQEHRQMQKRRILSANDKRQKRSVHNKRTGLLKAPRSGDIAKFPRVDDGLSGRVDESERRMRIKALGNSIVPQVAMIPLQRIRDLQAALEDVPIE